MSTQENLDDKNSINSNDSNKLSNNEGTYDYEAVKRNNAGINFHKSEQEALAERGLSPKGEDCDMNTLTMEMPDSISHVFLISMSVASVLAISKFIVGFYSGSVSVALSSVDSLLDLMFSAMNFVLSKLALKPADDKHRYGLGKLEPLAAFLQSMFFMAVSGYILYAAVMRYMEGNYHIQTDIAIWVMAFSTIATLFLIIVLRHYHKKYNSKIIEADITHYSTDLVSNIGVLVALVLIFYTDYVIIDLIMSVIIACVLFYLSYKVFSGSISELLDESADEATIEIIENIVSSYKEIISVHEFKTRKSGRKLFVEMHIEICGKLSLYDAHFIADKIEGEIKKQVQFSEVVTHLDPCKYANEHTGDDVNDKNCHLRCKYE